MALSCATAEDVLKTMKDENVRLCATADLIDRRRNILGTADFQSYGFQTERVRCGLHCSEFKDDTRIGDIANDR